MHRPKLHVGILAPVVAVFRLTALGQDSWAENYAEALAAYNAGHYDKARQALESALEYDDLPANKAQRLDAAAALAAAYEKLGQTVFAESWYAAIIPAIDENSDEERKILSVVLTNFGSAPGTGSPAGRHADVGKGARREPAPVWRR